MYFISFRATSNALKLTGALSSIILLLALFLLSSCDHHVEHQHHPESKFTVTSPLRKDTSLLKEYVCQIHSSQHIEMRALEKGYLQEIYVDEGQSVKKGQVMFQIMPMLYEAELQKAKAEVNYAQVEYQNTLDLANQNIVSKNELALVKAKLDKAQAELSLAEVHLSFTKIKAPFDGIMDRFEVRLGSLLDEGELLTKLSDNSTMWVYFNMPEAEYLDYQLEKDKTEMNRVHLKMANQQRFQFPGEITTIEADFNNATGNIAFRATFPNPNGLLRHGETGNILLEVPFEDALIIPQKTTFEILDKTFVFVLDDNDQLQAREIQVASELPHLYIVASGLEESDKILLDGLRKVNAKDHISYDFVAPEEALSQLSLYAE